MEENVMDSVESQELDYLKRNIIQVIGGIESVGLLEYLLDFILVAAEQWH